MTPQQLQQIDEIAAAYCRRLGIVSPVAKRAVNREVSFIVRAAQTWDLQYMLTVSRLNSDILEEIFEEFPSIAPV